MSKTLGLTKEELLVFTKPLTRRSIESGLAMVALDKSTKQIAGVIFSLSPAKEIEFNNDIENKLSKKFDPILDILTRVSEKHHVNN